MLKLHGKIWGLIMGLRMVLTLAEVRVPGWDAEGSTQILGIW